MSAVVTLKPVSGPNFGKGVKYLKQWGGKFDPNSKTWTVPLKGVGPCFRAWAAYYVVPVSEADRAHDSSCPARWGGVCECGN